MTLRCWRRHFAIACLVINLSARPISAFSSPSFLYRKRAPIILGAKQNNDTPDDDNERDNRTPSPSEADFLTRRRVLQSSVASLLVVSQFPQVSLAGEVGARINAAVTKSDLGLAVRESVVRGAQTMDKIDGQWEQFSDKFGLGAARKQQDGKPTPRVVPDALPLDTELASKILATSDQTFLSLVGVSQNALTQQISTVASKVRPSFERAGVELEPGTAQAFNFDSYTHFKAYSDLIMETKVPFNSFRKDFESKMGEALLQLLLPQYSKAPVDNKSNLEATLQKRLSLVDQVCRILVEKGLVAATERSTVNEERLSDWSDNLSDLTLNLALDGDITMNAQILLQEQGFRLYPNYAKYAVAKLLELPQQSVVIDDYYMDTDYNSDPDRFEVKQVLLSIVLDSTT